MREVKKRKPKKQLLLRLAILVFIGYVLVTLVNQQIQIAAKRNQLDELNRQIQIIEVENEDIKRVSDSGEEEKEEYIERAARGDNLNLVYPGERVFINIAGN